MAPNQGGYWEVAVKGVKHHLRRIIGTQIFSGDQWRTLLARIAAVMNSVPLSPLSDDPSDMDILTPGHFLTGRGMFQVLGYPEDGQRGGTQCFCTPAEYHALFLEEMAE